MPAGAQFQVIFNGKPGQNWHPFFQWTQLVAENRRRRISVRAAQCTQYCGSRRRL